MHSISNLYGEPLTVSGVAGNTLLDGVQWVSPGGEDTPWFGYLGENFAYRFDSVADVLVPRDGAGIHLHIHPGAGSDDVSFALHRGVFPRVLHLRGIPCLHASAVMTGEGVVAFSGESGAGKSTAVACLVAAGYPLVSDDVLPLRRDSAAVLAGPGLPGIRIHPERVPFAPLSARCAPRRKPGYKAEWQVPAEQCVAIPSPLARIYLLEPHRGGDRLATVTPVPPPEALLAMIRNSFWLSAKFTPALASDLAVFGAVVRSVPVFRLSYELSAAGFDAVRRILPCSPR
ncbi:MAG TPA: hypothetical protein VMH28_20585 [Candidatus Acidoferrales bacterium]|nr:hypothetical protein [Candidatus Acidoferrales bacterium]